MMHRIKQWVTLALVAVVVATAGLAPAAQAVDPTTKINEGVRKAGGTSGQRSIDERVDDVVNVLLFVSVVLAVIMMVIGGIRYTSSNGNAEQIKAAKNTVMYAIIGLAVAILAYAIVKFVVRAL